MAGNGPLSLSLSLPFSLLLLFVALAWIIPTNFRQVARLTLEMAKKREFPFVGLSIQLMALKALQQLLYL